MDNLRFNPNVGPLGDIPFIAPSGQQPLKATGASKAVQLNNALMEATQNQGIPTQEGKTKASAMILNILTQGNMSQLKEGSAEELATLLSSLTKYASLLNSPFEQTETANTLSKEISTLLGKETLSGDQFVASQLFEYLKNDPNPFNKDNFSQILLKMSDSGAFGTNDAKIFLKKVESTFNSPVYNNAAKTEILLGHMKDLLNPSERNPNWYR